MPIRGVAIPQYSSISVCGCGRIPRYQYRSIAVLQYCQCWCKKIKRDRRSSQNMKYWKVNFWKNNLFILNFFCWNSFFFIYLLKKNSLEKILCRLIFYLSIDTSVLQYWYISILPNMQPVLQYCHPSDAHTSGPSHTWLFWNNNKKTLSDTLSEFWITLSEFWHFVWIRKQKTGNQK